MRARAYPGSPPRGAATVIHGLHGRRRAGPGENFWQYRRFMSGRAGDRTSIGGARRATIISTCASANGKPRTRSGSGRTVRLDGLRLRAGHRQQARSRAGGAFRAGRGAGAGRRARRHSRPHAADREPQRDRKDGAGDRARYRRARQACRRLRAVAVCRNPAAVRLLEPDRPRCGRHHRPFRSHRRARPCRADRRSGRRKLPLFRPNRIHRAGRRRQRHRRPRRNLAQRLPGTGRAPPRGTPRRDRAARLELRRPPHRSAGRPNCCLCCIRAWAPVRRRTPLQPATRRRFVGAAA